MVGKIIFDREQEENVAEEGEKKERVGAGGDTESTPKKKVWNEKEGSRWTLGSYWMIISTKTNDPQKVEPSSSLFMVMIYVISSSLPRARRTRRYGRRTNKYTRNWEDEDPYNQDIQVLKTRAPR